MHAMHWRFTLLSTTCSHFCIIRVFAFHFSVLASASLLLCASSFALYTATARFSFGPLSTYTRTHIHTCARIADISGYISISDHSGKSLRRQCSSFTSSSELLMAQIQSQLLIILMAQPVPFHLHFLSRLFVLSSLVIRFGLLEPKVQ